MDHKLNARIFKSTNGSKTDNLGPKAYYTPLLLSNTVVEGYCMLLRIPSILEMCHFKINKDLLLQSTG